MVVVGSSDRPAVVLDVGSALTKAGFAGEVRPAAEVPSSVAPEDAIDMGGQPGSICPFKDGVVQNWDAMESLWQHVFYKCAPAVGVCACMRRRASSARPPPAVCNGAMTLWVGCECW